MKKKGLKRKPAQGGEKKRIEWGGKRAVPPKRPPHNKDAARQGLAREKSHPLLQLKGGPKKKYQTRRRGKLQKPNGECPDWFERKSKRVCSIMVSKILDDAGKRKG